MKKTSNISTLNKSDFEEVFKTYFKPLTAFAFKFVKDTDDAKSIVHDVFMKLWEKRDNIDMSKS
ncbi:MAG: RNA polymerase sigma-70 factor, partial [Bacteroidales bacterium]|nr:RNA polymerase sigma-70 factor [Bacteroidales bacterium]